MCHIVRESGSCWKRASVLCQLSRTKKCIRKVFQGHKLHYTMSLLSVKKDRIPERKDKPVHLTEIVTSFSLKCCHGNGATRLQQQQMDAIPRLFTDRL